MNIADLFYSVKAEGIDKVGQQIGNLADTLGNVGGLLIDKVSKPILDFFVDGVDLASDLTESMNVVNVTFGKAASEVSNWAGELLESFGLTEKEALQYVGSMGAMLKSSGLTAKASKDMSKSLVELTGDMSSFYNLSHDETWEKIRAGISGETEPLKALGINMSVANLEAYALSKGINKAWKEMSQAEQVTLRYNYLMQVSADSQGDFARTQDGFANKLRTVQGRIEEFSKAIGEVLLPYVEKAINFFDDLIVKVTTSIPGLDKIVVVVGLLAASLGPVLIAISGLIAGFGGLVGAVTAVVAVISTVGLPVFAAIAAILAYLPIHIIAVTTAFGVLTAGAIALLAKIGLLGDGFATIKALISGDFQKMFDLLTERLGMSDEQAGKLAKRFTELYDKAQIVITVIRDNLGNAFTLLKDKISDLVSGGFNKLDGSTTASKNLFIDMVQGIISWGEKLFGYLYRVLDAFDLIPNKLKFANNQIAVEFVELNASTNKNLDNILNSQFIFGEKLTQGNLDIYNKKLNDTKISLDNELNLVLEQLNKRKESELTALTSLFNDSKVLTDTEESARIEKLKQHYLTEQTELQNNNNRIKEILMLAAAEKRELTYIETVEIERLRQESESRQLQYISTSKAEQIRILEESKNLATNITKQEAMNIITESNRAYDKVVSDALKQKNEKINTIIQQRDGTHAISRDEANKMIAEANKEYTNITGKAEKTKNETITSANKKAGGVISAAEKEKREVESETDKLGKALKKIWLDIEAKIPDIAIDMMLDVAAAISEHSKQITDAAFKVGADLVKAMIKGIASKMGDLTLKVGSVMTAGAIPHNAQGTRNFEGGWSIVGERGAELVKLPQGSDIYSHPETKSMLDNARSQNSSQVTYITNNHIEKVSIDGMDDIKSLTEFFNRIELQIE